MLDNQQKVFAYVDKKLLKMPIPDIAKFKKRLDRVKNYQSLKEIIHKESENLFMGPKRIFKLKNSKASDAVSDESSNGTSESQVTIDH